MTPYGILSTKFRPAPKLIAVPVRDDHCVDLLHASSFIASIMRRHREPPLQPSIARIDRAATHAREKQNSVAIAAFHVDDIDVQRVAPRRSR